MSRRFDLVAVGGGMAGIAAAARASELGLRVAILEAGTSDEYLCATRLSSGIFHVAYRDPTLDPSELLSSIQANAGGEAPGPLTRTLALEAGRAVNWLRGAGIRMIRSPSVAPGSWMTAPPRRMVTSAEWRGLGPDVMLRALLRKIQSLGGTLSTGTRAGRLLTTGDGAVCGVTALRSGEPVTFEATSVVLADGGFSANPVLLKKYIAPSPDRVFQRSAATGLGDALTMALAAGAAASDDLSRFYGHLLSIDAFKSNQLWPYPQIDALASAGLIVDQSGRRVVDEGLGGIYAANEIARLENPAACIVVTSQDIWDGVGKQGLVPANPHLSRNGGSIFSVPGIAELAAKAGIPGHTLAETIDGYNRAVQSRTLMSLEPPRTTTKFAAQLIEPPFVGIPVCAGITNTMGGIRIDATARVLRPDGSFIPGLYAAGAAAGGIEGGPNVVYAGGLIKALVFGLIAAETAANNAGRSQSDIGVRASGA